MKLFTLLLTPLISFALLTCFASAKPRQPSMSAARNAARAVGWEVARRNPLVQSVKVDRCTKSREGRIHCLVLDRGSTSVLKTTCRVSVRVGVDRGRIKGALRGVSCHNKRLLLLRASDAEAAMQLRAQELSGHTESTISIFYRPSRTELLGLAAWSPQGSLQKADGELCSAQLRATLTNSEEIQVTTEENGCTKIPPDA